MSGSALTITGLEAGLGELEILKGVDLDIPFGEIHALMGPNGSGKSTLCHVLMGKPEYHASGSARVDGAELLGRAVHERARLGLFEAFQYPVEVPGVTLDDLMGEIGAAAGDRRAFRSRADSAGSSLGMERFMERPINQGLSGGEKKRSEIFQLMSLAPKVAILDEIDSGLDIDAVREVAAAVEAMRGPGLGVLLITHYSRILRYVTPDRIHVMMAGRVVRSGGPELAEELEAEGYDAIAAALGIATDEPPPADFLQGL
ncbi:MAG: Fe-S cluster assembly ATPase SufC [Actinobacteria bacterium]|nr:Fe-S cluster assembly ATPase SufC [Actinomycetota bacterium]MBU1865843.1 Fe-S cluster assembly ATPase SufC [Actinomycetota bacterium]